MRDANDLVQAQVVEAVADQLGRALGREALSPRVMQQPITDFDIAGRGTIFEAVPADERAGVAATRAPDAETVGGSVMAQNASERGIDFLFRHRLAAVDVFHYARVAVEP